MITAMKNILIAAFAFMIFSCGPGNSSSDNTLPPGAFNDALKADNEIILLDVRSPEEVTAGFIERAENMNYNDEGFSSSLDNLDHSKKYFVYCASGKRSGKAADLMEEKGFTNVTTLEGGFNAWKATGLPVKTN